MIRESEYSNGYREYIILKWIYKVYSNGYKDSSPAPPILPGAGLSILLFRMCYIGHHLSVSVQLSLQYMSHIYNT